MQFKRWGARLALGVLLFAGALACRTTDVFLAEATTDPTRTPRPTFTPLPPPTNTPAPAATVPPSVTPKPTVRATARPTTRPPTSIPKPAATPVPQPPAPAYQYAAASYKCEHSGGSWLKGHVYENKDDPNSAVPGIKVAFGGAGGDTYGSGETDGNGDFAFTLTADGAGAKIGTFYVWITDASGRRISDLAGPISINGRPDTDPNTCWAGWAYFTKNF
jgi:hypothetical protein